MRYCGITKLWAFFGPYDGQFGYASMIHINLILKTQILHSLPEKNKILGNAFDRNRIKYIFVVTVTCYIEIQTTE